MGKWEKGERKNAIHNVFLFAFDPIRHFALGFYSFSPICPFPFFIACGRYCPSSFPNAQACWVSTCRPRASFEQLVRLWGHESCRRSVVVLATSLASPLG